VARLIAKSTSAPDGGPPGWGFRTPEKAKIRRRSVLTGKAYEHGRKDRGVDRHPLTDLAMTAPIDEVTDGLHDHVGVVKVDVMTGVHGVHVLAAGRKGGQTHDPAAGRAPVRARVRP